MDDSLTRLKFRLDVMRKERDTMNARVLNERARTSQLEVEVSRLRSEYIRQKKILEDKETNLQRYNETIRESESAYNKLVVNSDKLLSALENEFSNITQKFK
ncbi:hypothetical protein SteCoe_13725 [Stentor coeruleus]|uniref:Uncharacterized protein n=1 Tax=Stentor coeruleus TaxID=5963 RepID=A0A1R2C7S2_9CILI|nr:hypothetical protein SteCoe_13725 [Stentor coeruleus]